MKSTKSEQVTKPPRRQNNSSRASNKISTGASGPSLPEQSALLTTLESGNQNSPTSSTKNTELCFVTLRGLDSAGHSSSRRRTSLPNRKSRSHSEIEFVNVGDIRSGRITPSAASLCPSTATALKRSTTCGKSRFLSVCKPDTTRGGSQMPNSEGCDHCRGRTGPLTEICDGRTAPPSSVCDDHTPHRVVTGEHGRRVQSKSDMSGSQNQNFVDLFKFPPGIPIPDLTAHKSQQSRTENCAQVPESTVGTTSTESAPVDLPCTRFVLDSASSVHICTEKALLSNIQRLSEPVTIQTLGGNFRVEWVGRLEGRTPHGVQIYCLLFFFRSQCSVAVIAQTDAGHRAREEVRPGRRFWRR